MNKQSIPSNTSAYTDTKDNPRISGFYFPLTNKRVTIIGLGGGGEIAMHLMRSGVGVLNLVDFDTLESGNLVRHVCGASKIGKNKAVAVKELLEEYVGNEAIYATAHDWDIFKKQDEFRQLVKDSDLVIIATDNDASRFFINEVCTDNKVPAVFVSMFQNGRGGEVFVYIPGKACYACLANYQGRQDFMEEYEKILEKADCSSARDVRAMPGIGIDQSFLSSLAARKTLDTLLLNEKHNLPKVGENWIIWSLFGIPGILENHISSLQADLEKHEHCLSCSF